MDTSLAERAWKYVLILCWHLYIVGSLGDGQTRRSLRAQSADQAFRHLQAFELGFPLIPKERIKKHACDFLERRYTSFD